MLDYLNVLTSDTFSVAMDATATGTDFSRTVDLLPDTAYQVKVYYTDTTDAEVIVGSGAWTDFRTPASAETWGSGDGKIQTTVQTVLMGYELDTVSSGIKVDYRPTTADSSGVFKTADTDIHPFTPNRTLTAQAATLVGV